MSSELKNLRFNGGGSIKRELQLDWSHDREAKRVNCFSRILYKCVLLIDSNC